MDQIQQQSIEQNEKQSHRVILMGEQNQYQQKQNNLSKQHKQQIFQIIRDNSINQLKPPQTKRDKIKQNILGYYSKIDLIRPQNPSIIIWNIIIILITLYFILQIPLLLGFGQQVWIEQTQNLINIHILFFIFLILDIILTPIKMYYKQGLLIQNKIYLLRTYYKGYFWIDLIGLISIMIPTILNQYFYLNFLKILYLPKVLTISKLNSQIIKLLVFHNKLKLFYQIARIVIFIYLIAHYLGIGFYIVGYQIYANNYYGPYTPMISWIYNSEAYSQMVLDLDWLGRYLYAMYFSIGVTTTIAYGDITPLNPHECLYIIFVLIANLILFGYILSQFLRILIEAFYAKLRRKRTKFTIENMFIARKITQRVRILIRSYLQQVAKEQKYRNRPQQKKVIDALPLNFKINLYQQIYGDFMRSINLFPSFPRKYSQHQNTSALSVQMTRFIQKILFDITQTRYLAGDIIYRQNESYSNQLKNHRVYFFKDKYTFNGVILGIQKIPLLDIENKIVKNQQKYITFQNQRNYFGQIQFFTGQSRSHWALSKGSFLVYQISRNSIIQNLKSTNKKQLQHLFLMKQTIKNTYCMICQSQNHNFKNCTACHFVPDIFESIQNLTQKQRLNRKQDQTIYILRIKRRLISQKSNALGNYKNLISVNQKKMLQKSRISMLAHSKHYRRLYHDHHIHNNNDTSFETSSQDTSQQDLDYLISQTRLLIQNLGQDKQQNLKKAHYQAMFQQQFDEYYNFQLYKTDCNYQNVIKRYNMRNGLIDENYEKRKKFRKSLQQFIRLTQIQLTFNANVKDFSQAKGYKYKNGV